MRALIISMSTLSVDPRILREAQWLHELGWVVETVGIGERPLPFVDAHYPLSNQPAWTMKRILGGLILVFAPYRLRYKLLTESRVPQEVQTKVAEGRYALVLINDIEFLPWLVKPFGRRGLPQKTKVLLDLHEYHPKELPPGTSYRLLMEGYWRWLRRFIPNKVFDHRTVVSPGISSTYADEFHIERPDVICNAPPFEEITPSHTSADKIDLIYHGHAAWDRHPELLIEAFDFLDDRFRLNLMLTGSQEVQNSLRAMAHRLGDKVAFHEPVPVKDISRTISKYDLAVLFFPPDNPNILFTFPNKFFESIQGRLGLVMGESPSMQQVSNQLKNGLIIRGWSAKDLAEGLNTLSREDVIRMKKASAIGAEILNASAEQKKFSQIVQNLAS